MLVWLSSARWFGSQPDDSLVWQERWQALTQMSQVSLLPSAPIQWWHWPTSDEDHRCLNALRRKMAAYKPTGAQLGWLLIPEVQAVEILPASGEAEPQRVNSPIQLDVGPLSPGLLIDLEEIRTA